MPITRTVQLHVLGGHQLQVVLEGAALLLQHPLEPCEAAVFVLGFDANDESGEELAPHHQEG